MLSFSILAAPQIVMKAYSATLDVNSVYSIIILVLYEYPLNHKLCSLCFCGWCPNLSDNTLFNGAIVVWVPKNVL